LLPTLFEHRVAAFYLELAGETDPESVLRAIAANLRPGQRVFVGVTNPIDPVIETAEQVRERVLLAAQHVPMAQLGTTDDCGFSPFADDRSTTRETAFAKIRARVIGTRLAAEQLGV
jgi:5-methyltetrahydropteroyltriglutamate--homocysteine methyltransferase